MKRNLFIFLLLTLMLAAINPLPAQIQGDILLQLRFYGGVRGPKPAEARVVTAYTLRPLFIGNFITENGLQEEETELKRVFNLKDLVVLVQTQWSWEHDKAEKRFQMVVLNGHEFLLQVVKLPAPDAFRVQVLDQGVKEKPALLDSEIVLPADKVSVFGFEDSLSQPYFLAMQRQADAVALKTSGLEIVMVPESIPVPKLIKRVEPVYPEKMLKSGMTASITLQVGVDEQGKVRDVHAFSEENEFVKASVAAIMQWQVAPLVVDGKAQPQTFTCTVNFLSSVVALDFSKQPPMKSFQPIWPTLGYIWSKADKRRDGRGAALLRDGEKVFFTSIFGKRINPMTKKEDFHPGIDIATKKGAPVFSTAAGKVTASEFNEQDGNRIVIDHGNGYTSAYHHLDSREVKVGDNVTQGQLIGTVGSTGVSMGPHLHFEIRYNGQPCNPFDFIGAAH
jgi:murein DD-endopeptidase MepM/ murein hydrolase activator NlpD